MLASLPEPRESENWNSNKLRVTSNGSLTNGNASLNVRDNRETGNLSQQPASRDNFSYNSYANAPPANFEQQALIQQKRGQQEFAARQQTQVDNNDILIGANSA